MDAQTPNLELILEAALMAAAEPLTLQRLETLFGEHPPTRTDLLKALSDLQTRYAERAVQLREVAGGWRFQVVRQYSDWVRRLWEEKPSRYSRATLETLALIAYRQPITRGEIEEVRGVAVSSQIIRSLSERNWIRVVGHREVPGRPALYATTREFLDHFNLKGLDDLPTLAEVRDLDSINRELELEGFAPAPARPDESASDPLDTQAPLH